MLHTYTCGLVMCLQVYCEFESVVLRYKDVDYAHCLAPHVAALALVLQALKAPHAHTPASFPGSAQIFTTCYVWSCDRKMSTIYTLLTPCVAALVVQTLKVPCICPDLQLMPLLWFE